MTSARSNAAPMGALFARRRDHRHIAYQDKLALPPEAVEDFYALPDPADIPVRLPGERARRGRGDYLFLWQADATHKHDTWYVRLRPARAGRPDRWSTGCRVDELDQALQIYIDFLVQERRSRLGLISPETRLVVDILDKFVAHQTKRMQMKVIGTSAFENIMHGVRRLLRFVDGWRVSDIDKSTSPDFMAWATTLRPAGGGYAHNTGVQTLMVLRRALHEVLYASGYRVPFELPKIRDVHHEVFDPDEIERIPYAALSGCSWDGKAKAWTGGFQADPPVLGKDDADDLRARRAYGRVFQLGIWFGSRVSVHLNLTWRNLGGPWLDLERGLLHRLGKNEEETNKRKGFCRIPPAALPILRAWREDDVRHGCVHVCHTQDFAPLKFDDKIWKKLLAQAGAKVLGTHACKHTCVHILKVEGVPLGLAADYLYTRGETLTKFYGPDWDVGTTATAAAAISSPVNYRALYEADRTLKEGLALDDPAPFHPDTARELLAAA